MNARKIIDGLYTSKNAESILETVSAGNLCIEESRSIWRGKQHWMWPVTL